MIQFIFWSSLALIAYSFGGYVAAVWLVSNLRPARPVSAVSAAAPAVSVLIAARNERHVIAGRIDNLLAQTVLPLEVLVGSDGSADATAQIARSLGMPSLRVFEFAFNRGRAAVHNDLAAAARGEVLVFTDAATVFAPDFLARISAPFTDPQVGCVVGRLDWSNTGDAALSANTGLYWSYELALRHLESAAGLLATGSGACMAVRRSLYRPLASDEDVDFATPIDVIESGARVIYEPRARAGDTTTTTIRGELRLRNRMTSKNLIGTLRRLHRVSPLHYPGMWWGIVSHKILRWLTPVWILLALAANLFLITEPFYAFLLLAEALAWALAAVGYLADRQQRRVPVASQIYSFGVANLGMLLGLLTALRGQRITTYEAPEGQ